MVNIHYKMLSTMEMITTENDHSHECTAQAINISSALFSGFLLLSHTYIVVDRWIRNETKS